MLYDYECQNPECKQQEERIYSVDNFPAEVFCSKCGSISKKIITLGYGGIQTNRPTWINDQVRMALQDSESLEKGIEKPIETRKELNDYLKKHGLVHIG